MFVVLPGDEVPEAGPAMEQVKVGPGLLPTPVDGNEGGTSLTVIRGGSLGHVVANKRVKSSGEKTVAQQHGWWVESAGRRYVPAANDHVIGQVTNRGAESYAVSLYGAHSATLPALAFEGATRRNRPNIAVGALVYARVVSAQLWTEPEISCIDAVTGKSGGLGELRVDPADGVAMVWPVSLQLAQSLTRPGHTLMARIAEHFPIEVAIGQNGLVWVRTATAEQGVAVGAVLRAANEGSAEEDMDEDGVQLHADDEMRALNTRISERGQLSEAEIARILAM